MSEYIGPILFILGVILLFAAQRVLNRRYRARLREGSEDVIALLHRPEGPGIVILHDAPTHVIEGIHSGAGGEFGGAGASEGYDSGGGFDSGDAGDGGDGGGGDGGD